MRIDPARSPCRPHPCSVEHADRVWTYRSMVLDWEKEREAVCLGYAAEEREFEESHPRPTFRDYLRHTRSSRA